MGIQAAHAMRAVNMGQCNLDCLTLAAEAITPVRATVVCILSSSVMDEEKLNWKSGTDSTREGLKSL